MLGKNWAGMIILFALLLTACAGRMGDTEPVQTSDYLSPGGDVTRSPLDPIPGEGKMIRGDVGINESELLILESYPVRIELRLKGTLPTPCHFLRAEVSVPDAQNRIQVEIYSLIEPDLVCIQVLEGFETTVNLGYFPDGTYTVWVNGEQVGEFTQ